MLSRPFTLRQPGTRATQATSSGSPRSQPGSDSLRSRVALSPDEAAQSLGVSRDFFDEHVRPELRVVRRGRRILISVRELERWLEASQSSTTRLT